MVSILQLPKVRFQYTATSLQKPLLHMNSKHLVQQSPKKVILWSTMSWASELMRFFVEWMAESLSFTISLILCVSEGEFYNKLWVQSWLYYYRCPWKHYLFFTNCTTCPLNPIGKYCSFVCIIPPPVKGFTISSCSSAMFCMGGGLFKCLFDDNDGK
jgi:hypothetical protein